MTLQPVSRTSLSDSVFQQLQSEIVSGRLPSGGPLPSERSLCEMLQVNRGAVREAVKRLEQAGLVSSQHGMSTQVLDYRRNAGLDLLPQLLVRPDGDIDLDVVRSVMEMRSAIGPDAARLCALRANRAGTLRLRAILAAMEAAPDRLPTLQQLGLDLWDELVEGSGNIAYRLAFNSMRRVYDPVREAMAEVLADELTDLPRVRALVEAVTQHRDQAAHDAAKALIGRGMQCVLAAISALQEQPTEPMAHT
jgi:GntR family transcriptional repressor for pyruvate dehydrogenase complex